MKERDRADGPPRGALIAEIGQSFYLMGLMALVMASWLGLGLLAVRVLG